MNTEKLAGLIVEIIQENYEEIITAHESGDWDELEEEIYETLQNVD